MENTHITQNTEVVTTVNKACAQVSGFEEMYRRFERRMHTQRHSESTKRNYAHLLAMISLYFGCLPKHRTADRNASIIASQGTGKIHLLLVQRLLIQRPHPKAHTRCHGVCAQVQPPYFARTLCVHPALRHTEQYLKDACDSLRAEVSA
jgi:hypothetical protein